MDIKEIVDRQLGIDFNCSIDDVKNQRNIFTEYKRLPQRRMFKDEEEMFLKIACVHGKLLISGKPEIIKWLWLFSFCFRTINFTFT